MSNESNKTSFPGMDHIERIQSTREVNDQQLVEYAPTSAEQYFSYIRNWINNECSYSKEIIELLIPASGDSKVLLEEFSQEIDKIKTKAAEISTGVIGQTASFDDELRTDYVSQILKKCLDLLPLLDRLYEMRKKINSHYDVLKKASDSSVEDPFSLSSSTEN